MSRRTQRNHPPANNAVDSQSGSGNIAPRAGEEQAGEGDTRWILYILRCGDGSYYTGITKDLTRRYHQHRKGLASRYTRGRGPIRIVYRESCEGKSNALRRERAVKAFSRKEKQELIAGGEK